MGWLKSEEEAEEIIQKLLNKGKGKYITQGVVFNKSNPREMELLKKAIMSSATFSGLIKEMLTEKFSEVPIPQPNNQQSNPPKEENETVQKRDVGNFL